MCLSSASRGRGSWEWTERSILYRAGILSSSHGVPAVIRGPCRMTSPTSVPTVAEDRCASAADRPEGQGFFSVGEPEAAHEVEADQNPPHSRPLQSPLAPSPERLPSLYTLLAA